jgi:hypothetical protein
MLKADFAIFVVDFGGVLEFIVIVIKDANIIRKANSVGQQHPEINLCYANRDNLPAHSIRPIGWFQRALGLIV